MSSSGKEKNEEKELEEFLLEIEKKVQNYNMAKETESLNLLQICNSLDILKQRVHDKMQVGKATKKNDLQGNID